MSEKKIKIITQSIEKEDNKIFFIEVKICYKNEKLLNAYREIGESPWDSSFFFDNKNGMDYIKYLLAEKNIKSIWGLDLDLLSKNIFIGAKERGQLKKYVTKEGIEQVISELEIFLRLPKSHQKFIEENTSVFERFKFCYKDIILSYKDILKKEEKSLCADFSKFKKVISELKLDKEIEKQVFDKYFTEKLHYKKINTEFYFKSRMSFIDSVLLDDEENLLDKHFEIINNYKELDVGLSDCKNQKKVKV